MKTYLSAILVLLNIVILCSQSKVIEGLVLADGELAIGANVLISNANRGTTTDLTGKFSIEANIGDLLQVYYLGYETFDLLIDDRSMYQIDLVSTSLDLDEVVVTALGLKRSSKALGYAIQSIDSKEVSDVKAPNFVDNLTAKFAGVSISHGATGVGSTSKIIIRGESSFSNNNPLFIVDGLPVNNNTIINVTNELAAGFQEVDFGNGAMDINPDDIESVSVLKGPGAAALYGARASNGVIVIETKDGSQAKGFGIDFNSTVTIDRPFQLPKFQNKYGQGNSGQFEFKDGLGGGINDNITYSYGPELDVGNLIAQYDSPVSLANGQVVRGGDVAVHGGLPITPTPFVSNPNNLKHFYETGFSRTNNISIGGASEKVNYRISLTNLDSESYIPGVNLERNTISTRLSVKPIQKLRINATFYYINSKSDNRPANGYGSENINYSLVAWLGRQTDLNPLKNYWQPGLEGTQQYSFNYTFFDNPYLILLENQNTFNRNRLFGNISASYQLNPKLSMTFRTGLDNSAELRTFKRAFSTNRFRDGAYAEHDVSFQEINTDFLVNYNNTIGDFGLDIGIGGNRMDQFSGTKQSQAIGLAQPGVYKLVNAAAPLQVFQYDFSKRINSFYAIAKFSYKDFLFLDVTGRNDWSSALATPTSTENTSFFYPSASASVILSRVINMPMIVSFAKIRASWARLGNDTNPYQTLGVFSAGVPVGGLPTFTDQDFIANENLLPEQSTAIEMGADIRFFDDRLNLDATIYHSLNENQILSLPIPISSGYHQRVVNGGAVRSQGLELVLTANPIRSRNFSWKTAVNFSRNISIVESLAEGANSLTLAYSRVYDNPNQTVYFIVREGDRIGDLWGTGYARNEDGDFIVTQEGKLTVDNSLKKLGNYNPDFILGFSNHVNFKSWSFGFLLDWRQGGEIVSRTQALAGVAGQLKETEFRPDEGLIFDGVINSGTEEEPQWVTNNIPISSESYYRQYYDRNHEENNTYDASYLKLRQIQLGYEFTKALLDKSALRTLKGLSFSVVGRNIFALSKIPHFDPEQIAIQGNNIVSGVEDMSYPSARSLGVSLGIKL